jgi:branched-chain amino acid transport system ATP-binding protein
VSLLVVRDLAKAFGGVQAVRGVSFDIDAREVVALIGPNGAGKSTCFNLLNGQLRPDRGSVRLQVHSAVDAAGGIDASRDITGLRPRDIWRLGVGRTFQIAATFASMTVAENVQMALLSRERRLLDLWKPAHEQCRAEALELLAAVGLRGEERRPVGELAYGQIKSVELAIALANRPALLLMDEPTAGMAPPERHALMALIRELVAARGLSVLFTEHSMDVVFTHADRVLVLARGELIAQGSVEQIRSDARVQQAYFGSGKTVPSGVL